MRIEDWKGKKIVCGHIFPASDIKPGSVWASASLGGYTVTVEKVVARSWVFQGKVRTSYDVYYRENDGQKRLLDKDHFSFQCRYCLVLEDI